MKMKTMFISGYKVEVMDGYDNEFYKTEIRKLLSNHHFNLRKWR